MVLFQIIVWWIEPASGQQDDVRSGPTRRSLFHTETKLWFQIRMNLPRSTFTAFVCSIFPHIWSRRYGIVTQSYTMFVFVNLVLNPHFFPPYIAVFLRLRSCLSVLVTAYRIGFVFEDFPLTEPGSDLNVSYFEKKRTDYKSILIR